MSAPQDLWKELSVHVPGLGGAATSGLRILVILVILVVAWLAIAAAQRAIRARFKVAPLGQWNVGREYLRRLKSAFDRAGIEVPFPQLIRRQPWCPGS